MLDPALRPTSLGNVQIYNVDWMLNHLLHIEEPHLAINRAAFLGVLMPLSSVLHGGRQFSMGGAVLVGPSRTTA